MELKLSVIVQEKPTSSGGVDGSKIGMKQYLIKIAPTPTSGNKARYLALQTQLRRGCSM